MSNPRASETTADTITRAISHLAFALRMAGVETFAMTLSPADIARLRATMSARHLTVADPAYIGRETTICGVPVRSERP